MTPYRFGVSHAVAWRIVAELSRRHAASRPLSLLELHPGISAAGMLRLMVGQPSEVMSDQPSITFRFGGQAGTCEVSRGAAPVLTDFDFVTPMLVGDPKDLVDRLESALGLNTPSLLPPSQACVLCARLIADILATAWLARQPLRTTSGWVDASVGCTVPAWTAEMGVDWRALNEAVARGAVDWRAVFGQVGRYVAVHASDDSAPMTKLDRQFVAMDMQTGALVFCGSENPRPAVDISQRYAADGRRLGRIVDDVLLHLGR